MTHRQTTAAASAIVLVTGALWGLYWIPVRALDQMGLTGAWGTLAITSAAALLSLPFALARASRLAQSDRAAIASVALGGAAFALYSVGLVYGRVAIVILLYFLTPVWSTLIGRYVMGWPTPRLRVLAILVGLAGLACMLGADGGFPRPRGAGEWMALIAGLLWSVATTGMRTKSDLGPGQSAFVFATGAAITAVILAPVLAPLPGVVGPGALAVPLGVAFAAGGVWWGLSVAALIWATVRLEPARVGILLMTEVLVGAASAALLAAEHLTPPELAGGALVLGAAVLEVWPVRGGAGRDIAR